MVSIARPTARAAPDESVQVDETNAKEKFPEHWM
jgi:hypothetical protein